MTAVTSGSSQVAVAATKRSTGIQLIRNIAVYTAIGIAVSAGGVLVGAMVLAPAVSRATPFFSGNAQNAETSGSVGQADGDGAASSAMAAKFVATEPVASEQFKPIAESIAAAKLVEAAKVAKSSGRPWYRSLSRQAGFMYDDTMEFAAKVPKITWVIVDVALVALFAGVWLYRRRANRGSAPLATAASMRAPAAVLPAKLAGGKGSRTPKAVAALAEAGAAPADIARRTGLPHDAVAMLLSLGTLNARQLQPPTA